MFNDQMLLWIIVEKQLTTKWHTRAESAADTRRYETANHCWKYNHDFDWENKKIMDYETNTTARKIKETIHSFSNNNHINRISHRLPPILFPALKLKGESEVNTSSNQNEKQTTNHKQALFPHRSDTSAQNLRTNHHFLPQILWERFWTKLLQLKLTSKTRIKLFWLQFIA